MELGQTQVESQVVPTWGTDDITISMETAVSVTYDASAEQTAKIALGECPRRHYVHPPADTMKAFAFVGGEAD